jgi:hypothetical protein
MMGEEEIFAAPRKFNSSRHPFVRCPLQRISTRLASAAKKTDRGYLRGLRGV